mmetsp:Transcript_84631/g.177027  ORF Transcript_84631/g.177027 Transcript_84631/m.177027 type:complete len:83 (-) Transcript_84631:2494-2742(-)
MATDCNPLSFGLPLGRQSMSPQEYARRFGGAVITDETADSEKKLGNENPQGHWQMQLQLGTLVNPLGQDKTSVGSWCTIKYG